MRRLFRAPAWLLIFASLFAISGLARAAHVHDPAHASPQQLQHCDLCHAFEAGHAPPAQKASAPLLLAPSRVLLPARAEPLQSAHRATAHRPRGPPVSRTIHA